MNIQLIAVGTRMPTWVREGYGEYAKRLNRDCRLKLNEIFERFIGVLTCWRQTPDTTADPAP